MKKIIFTVFLFILSLNIALATTFDYSNEPREKYYFKTFFTNEIVLENDIKFLNNEIYFFTKADSLHKKYFNILKPFWGIYQILENKLWYNNLKKLFDSKEIWILWQNYYNFDNKNNFIDNLLNLQKNIDKNIELLNIESKNNSFKDNNLTNFLENDYLNIDQNKFSREYINIYSNEDKKSRIYFYPYATNKFLWFYDSKSYFPTSEISSWYPNTILPKLTIIDNSILYNDIFIQNWEEKVFWKLKYKTDKFYLKRDLSNDKKPEFIYQIVPYYEFDLTFKQWENNFYIEYPLFNLVYNWDWIEVYSYNQKPNWVYRIRNS